MDEAVVYMERGGSVVAGGTQLGSKYLLGEQLGRGAMGVVYDATTTDGSSLAIKLLRPELASDDKTVARFVQERQIFRRIDHPNVVRVDDLVAEGDQLGIAMEKVCGGDLKQRVEARSLTPAVAMQVVADVAAGLEAIHAADVVHRDLKPANILLAETPSGLQPKISDFGISRLVSDAMTRTSTTIGTPLYMAPEAADKRGADAPADIYALGAMMFELLIGAAPFHNGGTFAVLRAHAQDAPPFIGGVPTELADLIDHMLAKEPSDRPTATEVRQRLLTIVPAIDDAVHNPVAIERNVDGVGSGIAHSAAGAGVGAVVAGAGVGGAGTGIGAAGADVGAAGIAVPTGAACVAVLTGAAGPADAGVAGQGSAAVTGVAAAGAATEFVDLNGSQPNDSAETRISSDGLTGFEPTAGADAPSFPQSAGTVSAGTGGLAETANSRAPLVLNRLHRRSTEIGIAIASLAAVIAVIAFVVTRGDDDQSAIGSEGGETTIDAGAGSDGSTPVSGNRNEGDTDPGGPGIFNGQGDDGSGGDENTATTNANGITSTTSAGSTTAAPTSSTTASTTSSTASTSTTEATTTTRPTTTTTQPTTTTTEPTTTTPPTPTAIAIVSTPTVDSVGPTSFHFNYSTNDVCGTGSFTVTEKASGTPVGSFTGQNTCYGPLHGGFPGHSSFPGFNLQPGTTYRVSISVKGTASDGARPAGSGVASSSFEVTTAG